MNKPLVSVLFITYNHEQYIRQSIERVINQVTDFVFEVVVGEDHSTDNTFSIIQSYQKANPDLIRIRKSSQNVGLLENYKLTAEACNGKYLAICSGDDYWTDPLKLQKQVDFLEANPDYGMVYTDFLILKDGKTDLSGPIDFFSKRKYNLENQYEKLLIRNFIGALTVCFRKSLFDRYIYFIGEDYYRFEMEDKPLMLFIAFNTKIYFLNEVTAIRRVVPNSLSFPVDLNRKLLFIKSSFDVSLYYINRCGCSNYCKEIVYLVNNQKILKVASKIPNEKESKNAYDYLKQYGKTLFKDIIYYYSSINSLFNYILKKVVF